MNSASMDKRTNLCAPFRIDGPGYGDFIAVGKSNVRGRKTSEAGKAWRLPGLATALLQHNNNETVTTSLITCYVIVLLRPIKRWEG
jgi:hypothetical protein